MDKNDIFSYAKKYITFFNILNNQKQLPEISYIDNFIFSDNNININYMTVSGTIKHISIPIEVLKCFKLSDNEFKKIIQQKMGK